MISRKTRLAPSRLALATVLGLAVGACPALAQTAPADTEAQVEDDLHNRQTDGQGNIIVSASGLKELDLLAGTSVLEAREIQRDMVNGQLGDLLTKIPGVSSTSFAPGSSRPVLRGQQGERVRVLIDGVGTADVSNTSVDHATSIDPITVERIEVLRGPAVLLYGSQAIGGAVNVIDKRIPTRMPDEDFHFDGFAGVDSASNMRTGAASLDVGIGSNLVFHVDGSWRETGNMDIGGFQLSPELRAELLEEAAEKDADGEPDEAAEFREAAGQRGFVPNSDMRSWTVNAGLGLILGESTFGAAIGFYDTNYGVIKRPGLKHEHGGEEEEHEGEDHGEEEGEENVRIDLQQFRADFKGDIFLGDGAFERLKVRVGYSDYTHTEFEGPGEVGTVFESTSVEARAELVQNADGMLRGATGIQYLHRDFFAVGEEAYVPPNLTDQVAIFTLQEFGTGPVQIEAAARAEFTDVEAQTLGIARDYETFSGALGVVYQGIEGIRIGINGSRAERAPSAEELFSDGPHIATQAFEIGDIDLRTERAWGLEAYARGTLGAGTFNLTVFKQWFDNYIFLNETGLEEDDLPVFEYLQQDADFFGIEADLSYPVIDTGSFRLLTDLRASYVEAEFADGNAAPRIPPLSLLGALEAQTQAFDVRGEVQWFDGQDRITTFETPTDSFTLVNALVAWRPLTDNQNVTVQLAADNIFDVNGRRHASFTKDFVPLMGRNFRASVRLSF
ncbi:TonB-dependent receptor [Erythrobacter sanguineus]|uniref:Iron complex outermembrane recepter protein n=1 Tax=Erythrobacter sanguineus TaxID=198312 RepID=A0A1M7T3T4_9SPHN|nr:TonB-dependent receptor [Erythrobacter sanguineus]SHN65337.1 iron complex outermembrane recepter protein [Erythrobacter sanguineus]